MNSSIKKKASSRKLLWLVGFLFALALYAGYYQLWHKSRQVKSNIYQLDKILSSHTAEIWSAKFTPDGSRLASGSVDSTARIWNIQNGTLVFTIRQPAGITSVDISPDGKHVVTSSYDGIARCFNMGDGKLVKEFTGHKGTIWSVNFSPDGKMIASCGEDATVKLWEVATAVLLRTFEGHTSNVWDVKFSPLGNEIASGSFDKTVKIWNLPDGKLLRTLTQHSEAVVALAYSPDGQKLVSTSDDKTIKLWDTKNWNLAHTMEVPEHNQAADFSPDNKLLVTGGRDKTSFGELLQNFLGDADYNKGVSMRLWNVQTGKLMQTFSEHRNDVNDVAFSPDGKWIAGASADRTIGLYKITSLK